MFRSLSARRAWIEISTVIVIFFKRNTSLSARRAWIEMFLSTPPRKAETVALRKESVDRNLPYQLRQFGRAFWVALRKESVDRNCSGAKADSVSKCRSPQGERG